MRTILVFVAVAIAGCTISHPAPKAPTKTVGDYYLEAHTRHYAGLHKWLKGIDETTKCYKLVATDRDAYRTCLDQAPPPETFLPKDRIGQESVSQYMERKDDEWAENACFYKGLMQARYPGESERIEDQCKRDLEVKRLRKAVEKLNQQKQQ